ncbi:hypothetical protein FWH13_01720 [Candidatus Saccharibacteria bacterium]|nr:hypothetical protein [Candidatus Saccharibacteria bacterium]
MKLAIKKPTIIALVAVALLILGAIGFRAIFGSEYAEPTADALRFKASYEELNGQPVSADQPDPIWQEIHIPERNPFRFTDYDEIIDLLERRGTAVVYLGFPNCSWCRNLVPVLADAAIDFGVEEILYRNISNDHDILQHSSLAPLHNALNSSPPHRISAPTVLFIQDGEIIHSQGNLQSFSSRVEHAPLGGFTPMNDSEIRELSYLFKAYFARLFHYPDSDEE